MRVFSRRLLRIAGWLLAILLIVSGAVVGAVWFGGAPAVAWLIEHPVSSAIGRQIRIAGPLAIRWGAPTQIIVNEIHVANASWGSQPEMFSARRLEIAIFARSLTFGRMRIPSIAFDGAKLLLETSDRGEANWQFAPAAAAPKKRSEFPDVERITVKASEIAYRNTDPGAQSTLTMDDAQVEQKADDAAATAGGVKIALAGAFQGRPLQLAGDFGSIAELRNPTKPYPVSLRGGL